MPDEPGSSGSCTAPCVALHRVKVQCVHLGLLAPHSQVCSFSRHDIKFTYLYFLCKEPTLQPIKNLRRLCRVRHSVLPAVDTATEVVVVMSYCHLSLWVIVGAI